MNFKTNNKYYISGNFITNNMKKILIYLIITILSATFVFAQQDSLSFKLITRFIIDANNFKTDKQGNIYVINNNELKKYNNEGAFLNSFSTENNYKITSIDISNPLKIMLFIETSNNIIFLNQTLNKINNIFLYNHDIYSPQLVCNSLRGGFYIYDNTEYNVFYISNNEKNQIKIDFFNNNFQPNFIQEDNNKLYLNYPDTGIVVLNNFFFEENFIPIKEIRNAQIKENNISFFDKKTSQIVIYNSKKKNVYKLKLPIKESDDARIEQDLLFILKKKQIFIYQFWK